MRAIFIFVFGLVWFGLVCVAVFAGNGDNLASGRELSTNKLRRLKNKFSFFACHARKPYSHKVFRRFQAGNYPEKYFRPAVNSGGSPAGKQRRANARWYVPREKPKRETQGEGMKGKEGRGRNERNEPLENLSIHPRKYLQ